ncbi:enolase C-terminal domain-like protein [Pseudonocardia sp. CA-142604]|uniref:enolase C-terminal domain-like protein n=1 Tax=Pseudonocardia sp. CA-142604 TaxID=3240024 RepID=UPI003D90614A
MDFSEITGFRVRPVVVPLQRPLRTASGEIPASPLLLIDIATEGRVTGHSYVFAYTATVLPAMVAVAAALEQDLVGQSASPETCLTRLRSRFRLLGLQGLLGMVISGVEMALWDALGKRLGAGVVSLLGGVPVAVPAYDSFGMVNPAKDAEQLRHSVEAGFRGVKIKLGYPDVEDDLDVVRWARKVVGANTELMVDYNQSLGVQEAERRIERLRDLDVAWIEEPVAAEDLASHSRVRRLAGGKLQSGENWWFPSGFQTALHVGASDLVMPDLVKVGGFTGWVEAARLAETASILVSSHMLVEASAHALAVTPTRHWLEYLDIAGPVLRSPLRPADGNITAQGPGIGITWNQDAAEKFAA